MLYSLRDAAKYTNTPLGTFRNHVYVQNRIGGVVKGKTIIFTQGQLDDYVANDQRTFLLPDASRLFTIKEAAEYAGMTEEAMRAHVFTYRNLHSELVGRVRIIRKDDLDDFIATKRDPGRPPDD